MKGLGDLPMLGDLTFTIGRSLGWLLTPAVLLAVALVGAGILLLRTPSRLNRVAGASAIVLVGLLSWSPLPTALLSQLEQVPDGVDWQDIRPGELTGIIVLGGRGAIPGDLTAERGSVQLNDGAERITTAVALARRDEDLRIVLSGGWASLIGDGMGEAETMAAFLAEQGVTGPRVILEQRSRNTRENAAFTAPIVAAYPGRWGLVTSASHMGRALAEFQGAGIAVTPLPVDYQTGTSRGGIIGLDPGGGIEQWSRVAYEGLARVQRTLYSVG